MTVAIAIKVNAGIVLATDSTVSFAVRDVKRGERFVDDLRSEVIHQDPERGVERDFESQIVRTYDEARKIVRLHKELPFAAVIYGHPAIGSVPLEVILKHYRNQNLSSGDYTTGLTMEDLCKDLAKFLKEEIKTAYDPKTYDERDQLSFGLLIAGYSSRDPLPQLFRIKFANGKHTETTEIYGGGVAGIHVEGDDSPFMRIYRGCDMAVLNTIKEKFNLSNDDIDSLTTDFGDHAAKFFEQFAPIASMVRVAEYLAEVSIGYHRFTRGASTVGGQVCIATVTRFEHFKWVKRDLYFDRRLNPRS